MLNEFDVLISNLENELKNLKDKIKFTRKEHHLMTVNLQTYVANPLNAFLLIKRLSYDVNVIEDSLEKSINIFSKNIKEIKMPMSDFEGAIEGFLRLQETYNLESKSLANGIILNKKYRENLSAEQLYTLGKHMIKLNTKYAEEYLKLALEKNKMTKEISSLDILDEIHNYYSKSDQFEAAINVLERMMQMDPMNKDLENRLMRYELHSLFHFERESEMNESDELKEAKIFAQACRGERLQDDKALSKLYCFYQSNSAFTKFAPFKVEVVNLNPYIAIFHDIVSNTEIKAFLSLSQENLKRALILNSNSTMGISKTRIAKLKWINDKSNEVIEQITRRVGDMSGLNMSTAEMWQIQNYGIGGHFSLHHDFLSEGQIFNTNTGNRIATLLVYLSDVERGGATVFPFLKIYVAPRKGSAVFWHNLSSSGDREYITLHGGCPVLVGSKWVANKWLHEYGQEWARPCELKPAKTNENYEKHYIVL